MSGEKKTRGQVEAAIATAIARFEREFLGRGPRESRAFLVRDMVLVRIRGILTPAEQQLSHEPGGVGLLKQMRTRLVEGARAELVAIVEAHTATRVASMHTDLNIASGERMFVFVLEEDVEGRLTDDSASLASRGENV